MRNKVLKINFDPSPITRLGSPSLDKFQVQLLVKRDDLLQPTGDHRFCGNKVRKLKYNLQAARAEGFDQLLTFGGAFSNHIAAVASAGRIYGFQTIGVIRGEPHLPLNPTLAQAKADGMKLHYLDRATYRQKSSSAVLDQLSAIFGKSYVLPEGGTNALALEGCTELAMEIKHQLDGWPDYLAAAFGTGGTLAGLIRACAGESQVLGVSSLKGNWMSKEITKLLGKDHQFQNWQIFNQYHFGGYAKFPTELQNFTRKFEDTHGIKLDPIYTSKLFYGIMDQISHGFFPNGAKIVIVHSGGMQGWNDRLINSSYNT